MIAQEPSWTHELFLRTSPSPHLLFARPIRGICEWDETETENEAESRQDERTALRRRPQAFEKRSRRARRKTLFSPGGMASIARRSPNGRRVSFRATCGWVRKIPVQNFSLSTTK